MRALTPLQAVRRRAASRRPRVAVALTVAAALAVAACGNDDELPAVEGATSPAIELTATEMAFDPASLAVSAGEVDVVLHNEGSLLHDLHIGDEPFLLEAAAGDTATASVTLEPGRYEFFCAIPGHREAGMEGVLEVR